MCFPDSLLTYIIYIFNLLISAMKSFSSKNNLCNLYFLLDSQKIFNFA